MIIAGGVYAYTGGVIGEYARDPYCTKSRSDSYCAEQLVKRGLGLAGGYVITNAFSALARQ